jgi:hypothetical protein
MARVATRRSKLAIEAKTALNWMQSVPTYPGVEADVTPDERLTEVFDRGLRQGVDRLTAAERDFFAIQDFIIELEMSGLSGYFYNRLPDLANIRAAVEGMRRNGLPDLAGFLAQALELFQHYVDPDPPSTWREVLKRYDPLNRLNAIEHEIYRLDAYGLPQSGIA